MKRHIRSRHSIYVQMLVLLAAACLLAACVFLLLDAVSEHLFDRYMTETDYAEKQNRRAVAGLQEYITSNGIHSRDEEALSKWVQGQKLLFVSIYKDGIKVFDSDYPDQQIWNEEIVSEDYDWIRYDNVVFEDGTAEIVISGAWRYQLYSRFLIIETVTCFLVFLTVALLGIRRKMRYIRKISEEVEALEGGNLNCPVTVRGSDELTVLAEGLDSMRRAFLDSRAKEAEIVRNHRQMITEMSHDLRTPVTSIMLYTEILAAGKCKDDDQKKQYVEKIHQKVLQLKEQTDSLLSYSLGTIDTTKVEMESDLFSEVFYDLLSETCGYLEQRGFRTELHVEWPEIRIRYNVDYTVRIMDNIMSNIVKYADARYPVVITLKEENSGVGLSYQNRTAVSDKYTEGTGVGIQSIRSMMKDMGGICRSECKGTTYRVEIIFPSEGPDEKDGTGKSE